MWSWRGEFCRRGLESRLNSRCSDIADCWSSYRRRNCNWRKESYHTLSTSSARPVREKHVCLFLMIVHRFSTKGPGFKPGRAPTFMCPKRIHFEQDLDLDHLILESSLPFYVKCASDGQTLNSFVSRCSSAL